MTPTEEARTVGTREAVLQAATRKFAEKSFLSATTAEIAVEAGVSEKTLFDLFGDKKSLYLKVRETIRRDAILDVLPNLPIGGGAPTILRALGREFLRVSSENRDIARVSTQAITSMEDPEIRKSLQDFFVQIQGLVAGILREGRASDLVREDLDTERFAWTFTIMLHSLAYLEILDTPSGLEKETAFRFIDRLVSYCET